MKIIKGVGERLPQWLTAELRPILAFTGAGAALWAGTCELVQLGWAWLAERLGFWERLGALAAGGHLAVYGCVHAPHIARFAVPAAAVAWCVAAWWIAPPVLDEPAPEPRAASARDGFILWLVHRIGKQPGIHLRNLYPAMRELPGHEGRDNTQLRAALRALGIPVRRSLRLGGVAGRSGVALADLQPLPSPLGELSVESDGDAGQGTDSPGGEPRGERLESA
ncbi:hypothetical protein [Streptomyces adelaidensis]|uniref:hypothetical protein n=1 Tax=Streptomyces adelaidensis TaxID=2796465 RepID=UPI0019035E38|nr:hypothetical protein [Streptomyces adelaidensis]